MASLKEVRIRIMSVISTQQITKAMKMVSAAKLRKAQNAITQMRPYEKALNNMVRNVLSSLDNSASSSFGAERPVENACVVIVTSNRGLAGAFNSNIIKAAVETINNKYAKQRDNGKLTIICIGKKGNDFMRRRYPNCKIVSDYVDTFSDLGFDNVKKIAQVVMSDYEAKKFDSVSIAYGRFKNAGTQFPVCEQFLPITKLATDDISKNKGEKKMRADYIFEPGQEELLESLVPSILQTTFYKSLLDTHASEHGARMTAMDKATENANEMLKNLRINYNKARQEAITKELSEIVGGAAALSA